jgi:proteasome ATPase
MDTQKQKTPEEQQLDAAEQIAAEILAEGDKEQIMADQAQVPAPPPEPGCNDPKKVIARLQDELIYLHDKLASVLADPKVHATVVRAENELKKGNFKKDDYVIIIDPELKGLTGRSAKLVADGWDENGEVIVILPNLERHRLAVGVDGDEPQIQLVGKNDGRCVTLAVENGQLFEVNGMRNHDFKPGDTVQVHMGTKQIIDPEGLAGPGTTGYVRTLIDELSVEVECDHGNRVVLIGDREIPMEVGDRVMLDRTGTIILKHLGKVDEGRFHVDDLAEVSWDDIGGCEDAKRAMIETVELPFRHPEIYQFYDLDLPKGVLLAGPPGCGKTLIAKAAANSISKIFGVETFKKQFFSVKGPELLSMYVGHTEQIIRDIFHRARKATKKSGHPSFIFIDEAEAILPMRGSMKSSDVNKTIVPMFLAEMDGLQESQVIVILATNRAGLLDPAVVRHGRIDQHIKVARPDEKTAAKIFNIHAKGMPLFDVDENTAAAMVVAELYSKSRTLYNVTVGGGTKNHLFCLRDAVNGGMIRGIVQGAKRRAVARDLQHGRCRGVTMEDFSRSVDQVYKEQQNLDHQFDVEDFLDINNLPRCDCKVERLRSDD